ncbi:MAG: tetratricopeptide repeat protein [Ktedonobacteraceae bacterium]|nr:tetratricopeptide repeat protein [Ktedonobacteraceae bacterium]
MIRNQDIDVQMQLYQARLLLEEGSNEKSLSLLETIQTDNERQQGDVAYLLGWCYIQRRQWKEAILFLSPLLDHYQSDFTQEATRDQGRLACYLLYLGIAAMNLEHYEDASLHFQLCLKVLHDRRIHLPAVRVQACYSLAMTCVMRGLYTAAIQHYEEALRLCQHFNRDEELAPIYYGLCETYRHLGDYVKSYLVGQEALHLYQERAEREMEAETHHLLGRICFLLRNFRQASDHYTESLSLSTVCDKPTIALLNYAALADLRLAEGRLDEAKLYCQRAIETIERTDHTHIRGAVYQAIGKVTQNEARQVIGTQRRDLLERAFAWYKKAEVQLATTQAYTVIAEVYSNQAQVLEELGRAQDAIERWRQAYGVLSHAKV